MANVPTDATNIYHGGLFAPVADEVTEFDLAVEGELPAELNGRYLRNGPNPFPDVDASGDHWFVGPGMVHGLRLLEGNAVWYRNRYVGSKALSDYRGVDDIAGPNWNGSTGGPNTNVGGFAGTTWAMVEAGGCPVELDYELETIGRSDFSGTLPGAFTAHPKVDPVSGEMHAMAYSWGDWLDHAQYVVVGTDGLVRKTVDIPMGMTMLHDMSLTSRYAVVYDQPCTVDLDLAFGGSPFPFRWNPDYGNRVGLLPREGVASDIIWADVPVGYAFHPMNAYDDDDGNVVIDLCNYDSMFANDVYGPLGDGLPRLERWEINPTTATATTTVIDETPNEFPRHRGSLSTQPYRYGYTVGFSNLTAGWASHKHDLVTGERETFDHGPGRGSGEAVFVAKEGSTDEDAGWLLSFVHDANTNGTDFVVLDAQDFDRGYVAKVTLPQRVPYGFHGNWVSDRSVAPDA